jgi:hypothetical protein
MCFFPTPTALTKYQNLPWLFEIFAAFLEVSSATLEPIISRSHSLELLLASKAFNQCLHVPLFLIRAEHQSTSRQQMLYTRYTTLRT